jgi:hypothetical protein
MRKVCEEFNVHHKQYITWTKQLDALLLAKKRNLQAKSLCVGRASILKPIADQLTRFIFELREQGMGVTINMVQLKAAMLLRSFREKSKSAQYNSTRLFIRSIGMVYRIGTHESQKDPRETESEAIDYIENIRPKLTQPCRHLDFIINMDQTPVPFTYNSKKTLSVVGRKTVHRRKSTNDMKRATFAMTVTASGKVLTPLLVFKGKPGGRIEKREFPTYPSQILYACQDNAWMDEKVMLIWVEKVLKPYVQDAPEHVVPLLFLDSYRCHMMASVVDEIHALGIEVEHIPGGCTYICQPVDVGVNKPFKNRIRAYWEAWMINEGVTKGTTSPPTREDIAKWSLSSMEMLPVQVVMNAWRHGKYSWFPVEEEEEQQQQPEDQQP